MNEKTYCVNAFHALTVGTPGDVKLCCMAETSIPNKNVIDHSLVELFNDDHLKQIRNDLSNGIQNPNCNRCWNEEAAGRKSKRLRDNENLKFDDNESLRILELNLGNACNIKCRTCGSWNSNQWIKERFDLEEQGIPYNKFLIKFKQIQESFDDNSSIWPSLTEVLPNLSQIDFYGGEPFLSKKQWALIKTSVDKGYAKNLKIHYNTNGTIWNDDQINLLSSMRIADVSISVDGVGDRFEYMRHPAKWETVHENILKAVEWSKKNSNVVLTLCYTISILNIWYISDIIEYGDKHGVSVYLNLVHWPDHYSIQNIPEPVKLKIEQHLKDTIPPDHSAWYWLNGIITFMNQQPCNIDEWNIFLNKTDIHDDYRNESYSKTFPEFYNIIKEYK